MDNWGETENIPLLEEQMEEEQRMNIENVVRKEEKSWEPASEQLSRLVLLREEFIGIQERWVSFKGKLRESISCIQSNVFMSVFSNSGLLFPAVVAYLFFFQLFALILVIFSIGIALSCVEALFNLLALSTDYIQIREAYSRFFVSMKEFQTVTSQDRQTALLSAPKVYERCKSFYEGVDEFYKAVSMHWGIRWSYLLYGAHLIVSFAFAILLGVMLPYAVLNEMCRDDKPFFTVYTSYDRHVRAPT